MVADDLGTPAAPGRERLAHVGHAVGDAVHEYGRAGGLHPLDVVGDGGPIAEREVEHDDVDLAAVETFNEFGDGGCGKHEIVALREEGSLETGRTDSWSSTTATRTCGAAISLPTSVVDAWAMHVHSAGCTPSYCRQSTNAGPTFRPFRCE